MTTGAAIAEAWAAVPPVARGFAVSWAGAWLDVPPSIMTPAPPDLSRQSDETILAACARGDHRAWRELVNRYGRLVYGIPRAMGVQPADCDDVFQHTFAELLRYLPRLRQPERLEAWLVTVARRESVRLRRGERRRMELAAGSAAGGREPFDPPVDVEVERLREGEWVRRALERLGDPCRRLLLGVFSDPARPYRSLARELGLAVGSLGSLRGRCLERLRSILRRQSSASRKSGNGPRRERLPGRRGHGGTRE